MAQNSGSRTARKGRPVARKWNGNAPKLREAVRDLCLRKYRETFEVNWNESNEGTGTANELERDARRIFRELHQVMGHVRTLAERASKDRDATGQALTWLLSMALPLAKESTLSRHGAESWTLPLHDEQRVQLIRRWETYWCGATPVTAKQWAIISLLTGIWPNLHASRTYSAADVVREEEKRIRPLLKRHQRPIRHEE